MQVPCKILQNHNCLMPSDVSKYMYLIIWRYCQWQALLRHWQKVLAPHVDGIDCKKRHTNYHQHFSSISGDGKNGM